MEEFLSETWHDFGTGKGTIEDVVAEYDRLGFDTNQDGPGNLHWEALYDASPPGTKVILTVRDNEDQWFKSWLKFQIGEHTRMSIFGVSLVKFR